MMLPQDKELPERQRGERAAIQPRVTVMIEWAARTLIVVVFSAFAIVTLAGIHQLMPIDSAERLLAVGARFANFMFLALVAATALTRLSPILKASGIEPLVSALLGTFLSFGLAMLPMTDLILVLSFTSIVLILVGAVSSFV